VYIRFPSSPFIQGFVTNCAGTWYCHHKCCVALPLIRLDFHHPNNTGVFTLYNILHLPLRSKRSLVSYLSDAAATAGHVDLLHDACWWLFTAFNKTPDVALTVNLRGITIRNVDTWNLLSVYETSFSTSQKTIFVFIMKTKRLCCIGEKQRHIAVYFALNEKETHRVSLMNNVSEEGK